LAKRFSRPLCANLEEAVEGSDALVLVTEHDVFRNIKPASVRSLMRVPNLICGRPGLDMQAWRDGGFAVYVLGGRPSADHPVTTS
jgi:UDP-N-acetyl-D-mannosaminuronate dehydrogenase